MYGFISTSFVSGEFDMEYILTPSHAYSDDISTTSGFRLCVTDI